MTTGVAIESKTDAKITKTLFLMRHFKTTKVILTMSGVIIATPAVGMNQKLSFVATFCSYIIWKIQIISEFMFCIQHFSIKYNILLVQE